MIVKEAIMRSAQRESIATLDEYLSHGKNCKISEEDRVAYSFTGNTVADNPHDARIELDATARCNQRAKSSKFLHLIISNKVGEHLSQDQWKKTANELAASLGMKEHQFIAYVHKDTDHEHMHLVICKVHPENYKLNVMSFGWSKLTETAARLERDFHLTPDNHLTVNTKAQRQSQAIERISGQQSFFSYISEFKDKLLTATSWQELHNICREHSVDIKKSGRGIVFTTIKDEREICIKASAIDRNLSLNKLENKINKYVSASVSDTNPVNSYEGIPVGFNSANNKDEKIKTTFAIYKQSQQNNQRIKTYLKSLAYAKFRQNRNNIEKLKRQASRALKIAYGKNLSLYTTEKQRFDSLFKNKEKNNRNELNQDLKDITAQYSTTTYLDWLKKNREKTTEKQTKELLQSRTSAKSLSGDNCIDGSYINVQIVHTLHYFRLSKRTGTGQDIFTSAIARGDLIRDDGRRLIVSKHPSLLTVTDALFLAQKRFDQKQPLIINGNADFQRQAAILAAQMGLNIQCASSKYQKLYIQLQEQNHERNKSRLRTNSSPRRVDRNPEGAVGNFSSLPEFSKIGGLQPLGGSLFTGTNQTLSQQRQPPTGNTVYLPQMQRSNVVGIENRNQMLLQSDPSDSMDLQRLSKNDNGLRWKIPSSNLESNKFSGSTRSIDPKLHEFIEKRNKLRTKGIPDILEHRIFNNEHGDFEFCGIRNINQKNYALLKQNDVMYVKLINEYGRKRLKTLSLHASVKILSNGKLEVSDKRTYRK